MRAADPRSPSPLAAATASAAFPGWGQIRVGYRRAGSALAAGTALFLAASAAAMAVKGRLGLVGWVVDPELLLTLVIVNLVFAMVRVGSTTHAWLAAGGRRVSSGLTIVLLLVTVPHVAIGVYGLEMRSTLLSVFPGDEQAPIAVEDTTTTAPSTTKMESTTTPFLTGGEPTALPVPELALPTTTVIPQATTTTLPFGKQRLTVLLLGGDSGPRRHGLRTDTVIVASVDTVTGNAVLFGLPRNMGGFTFSDGSGFPGLSRGLLNEVYQWGWRTPARFRGIDPGAAAVSDVASTLLGIPIDYFVLVDMIGFAELVDALGGVTVHVERELPAPLYNRATGDHTMVTIPAGAQDLNGDMALAYGRTRTGSNDYARMARQRCLLTALAGQIEPMRLFGRFGEVLDAVQRSVTTDIPLSKIPYIVNLAPLLDPERVIVVGFDRGYRSRRTVDGLPIPGAAKIQAEVQHALAGEVPEGSGLRAASTACAP